VDVFNTVTDFKIVSIASFVSDADNTNNDMLIRLSSSSYLVRFYVVEYT